MKTFEEIVTSAIQLNIKNREIEGTIKKESLSLMNYINDYCSIKINIGRATGKTEYICKHAKANDLVITHGKQGKRYMMEKGCEANIIFLNEHVSEYVGIPCPDYIYVDEPHLSIDGWEKEFKILLDMVISNDKNQTIVYLGE